MLTQVWKPLPCLALDGVGSTPTAAVSHGPCADARGEALAAATGSNLLLGDAGAARCLSPLYCVLAQAVGGEPQGIIMMLCCTESGGKGVVDIPPGLQ